MDINLETKLINTFFSPNFSERLLFELSSEKHRYKFYSKIAHKSTSYLKNNLIQYASRKIDDDLLNDFFKNDKQLYIMSDSVDYNGAYISKESLFSVDLWCLRPFVVTNIQATKCYIETEHIDHAHDTYLLKNK